MSPMPGIHAAPISGSTRCLALIGHPVDQVRSPPAFNRWFAERNIDAVIFPVDLAPSRLPDFFAMLRGWHNCIGLSVTMPHKAAALALVDDCTPRARQSGALNIVRREADGRLVGDMVDGLAFVSALRQQNFDPAGRRCAVIGAGGAGRAIAHALAEVGAASLAVVDIDSVAQERLLADLRRAHARIRVSDRVVAGELDLLVNASPLGMRADDPLPFDPDGLAPGALVADVVTKPAMTRFLLRAAERGRAVQTGHAMADAQLPLQMTHFGLLPK
jgi:shikimate dehydrogenase